MATALHNRVEDYIGPHDSNMEQTDWLTAMSEWLTASARSIFEVVPIERLSKVTPDPASVGVAGYALSGKRVLSVDKDGYPATEFPVANIARAKDSGSLLYATAQSPVFYIKGGKLFIVADGAEAAGTVHYIESPLVDYDQTEISYFPKELETLVVIGAAVRGRIRQLADKRAKLKEYVETEEDSELAQAVNIEIAAMQGELQALQGQYQSEFEMLARGMATQ